MLSLTGIINKKFGLLTVIEKVRRNGRVYWMCLCECGNEKAVRTDMLTNGECTSCGCQPKKRVDTIKVVACSDCQIFFTVRRRYTNRDGFIRCKTCSTRRRNSKYNQTSKAKMGSARRALEFYYSEKGKKYRQTAAYKEYRVRIMQTKYNKDPEYYREKEKARRYGTDRSVLHKIIEKYPICALCGGDEDLEFDHIYPESLGGQGNEENLQRLCKSCNSFKSNHLFMPGGGMLVVKRINPDPCLRKIGS